MLKVELYGDIEIFSFFVLDASTEYFPVLLDITERFLTPYRYMLKVVHRVVQTKMAHMILHYFLTFSFPHWTLTSVRFAAGPTR
jgi:hypothetical protein